MELPDVSHIAPVDIPTNATRSPLMQVTFINEYNKYEKVKAYWDDIDKKFRGTDGLIIVDDNEKVARTKIID